MIKRSKQQKVAKRITNFQPPDRNWLTAMFLIVCVCNTLKLPGEKLSCPSSWYKDFTKRLFTTGTNSAYKLFGRLLYANTGDRRGSNVLP